MWIEKFESISDNLIPFNWNGEDTTYQNILNTNNSFNVEDCIPLLTETQLRKFIEEKTNGVIIKIELVMKNYYDIEIHGHKGGVIMDQFKAKDIIDLYWQMACQIAQEG